MEGGRDGLLEREREKERRVCVSFFSSFILGCNSIGLTLNFNMTMISNNTEYITGIPTECGDGFILTLCNDGSIITQETSDTFCQSLRYNSKGEREGGGREEREGGEGGRERGEGEGGGRD